MSIVRIILLLAAAYFGFHLCRSLITGKAQVFRGKTVTPKTNAAQYWGHVAFMTFCTLGTLYLALIR